MGHCLSESSRRRPQFEIMDEILEAAGDGANQNQIMYRADLNYVSFKAYTRNMLAYELLIKINPYDLSNPSKSVIYKRVEKGVEFQRRYREMMKLLDEHSEDKGPELKIQGKIVILQKTR